MQGNAHNRNRLVSTTDRNPQAQQMGDESMARTLAAQALAIWPQEQPLFARYGLGGAIAILDLGCGTGEITRRLADLYPHAEVTGVDILDGNLVLARRDSAAYGERVRYAVGDAFALEFSDAHFDLVVCRHMSQAVPHFDAVLEEIGRVLRRGGWLHLLSEDYGMLRMPRHVASAALRGIGVADARDFDADRFWVDHALKFLESIHCDGRVGRHSPALLEARGYTEMSVDYVIVDTLRVPRATFADLLAAWRDGFAPALAEATGRSVEAVRADFDTMIEDVRTPPRYVVWHVPVIGARRP
jgi:ubiquinone/menaquinone biosynthesis C-methylase UbiE